MLATVSRPISKTFLTEAQMNFPSQMYIAGELTDGASTKAVINPATESCVATVATAGLQDAERALQAPVLRFQSGG